VKCLSTKRCRYGAYKHFTYYLNGYFLHARNEEYLRVNICPLLQWRSENVFCWIENSPDVTEKKDVTIFPCAPNGMIIAHPSSDVFSFHQK
jgi:hypothetical protein